MSGVLTGDDAELNNPAIMVNPPGAEGTSTYMNDVFIYTGTVIKGTEPEDPEDPEAPEDPPTVGATLFATDFSAFEDGILDCQQLLVQKR